MKKLSALSILLVCSMIHIMGQVINVPAEKPTIQAGIDSASTGDTVLVAEGTYFENINFLGKAITVASGFILDGDTSHISKTIIDGSHFSDPDSSSTVSLCSGEDTTSILMGFTITGGKGTNFAKIGDPDVHFIGGGGIFILGSGGKIEHNIIEENHVEKVEGFTYQFGGGVFAFVYNNHTAVIRDNIIGNNSISGENAHGGGISAFGGMILIESNVITDNSASSDLWVFGGGLSWISMDTEGVIKEVVIRNNLISRNFSESVGKGGGAAGINIMCYNEGWHPQFYNNILHDNHTELSGGGAFFEGGSGSVFNNTIVNNSAGWGNNIAITEVNKLNFYNNIIWSPEVPGILDIHLGSTPNKNFLVFNNILLKPLGIGSQYEFNNIYKEPSFQPGSFYLSRYSPGIGMGIDSVQINSIWYYAPSFDFYGNARPDPIASHPDLGAIESPFEAGIVDIPDTAFLYALIDDGVDTDADSLISYAEAEAVGSLDVSGSLIFDEENYRISGSEGEIVSLAGIESFKNLETLNCRGNRLTYLDLTGNPLLKVLDCSINALTSLSFPKGSRLDSLRCGMNPLTDLDVSRCSLLRYLELLPIVVKMVGQYPGEFAGDGTDLTELDITSNKVLEFLQMTESKILALNLSNNTALRELYCYRNRLTDLNISSNIDLRVLGCGQNQLTSLDVSVNTKLEALACQKNLLETLNLSSLTALIELFCGDNLLETLDLSANTALTYIDISNMSTLKEVCVWTSPFPPNEVSVCREGSPNVNYTTDCNVGIKELDEAATIYPNPTDGILTVDLCTPLNADIKIYNTCGSLIYSNPLQSNQQQIDLSAYPRGLYFVKVRQQGMVKVGKVVLE